MSECKPCRHIMPTGRNCQSPAMRGNAYCYYHYGPQKSGRRASRPIEAKLEIEVNFDPASIALNADRILQALASNQITSSRAAIMFQGLQTVLASFRFPVASFGVPPSDKSDASPQQSGPRGI
ncbi:MAG TPA: hypothetical protein VHZ28_05370 [Terracidiphilus sp.]|nr:hypothetical protein [Terracidiphilus sp.]